MPDVATFLSMTRVDNLKIYRWQLSPVPPQSAAVYQLDLPRKGSIRGVKFFKTSPASVDFHLSQHPDCFLESLDLLLWVEKLKDYVYGELFDPPIPYFNNSSPIESKLYLSVTNSHASEELYSRFELTIQHSAYARPSME